MVEEDKIMGLDCYIVHNNDREKKFTHEDDDRIKDINLMGGMFSGYGVDGSFRGKFYNPLIFELSNGEHTWYIDQSDEDPYIYSDTLKEQADLLGDLIQATVDTANDEGIELTDETIIYTTKDGYAEYNYKEVQDLETLLRVAAERKAVMSVWY
jgi:hypothetical protein